MQVPKLFRRLFRAKDGPTEDPQVEVERENRSHDLRHGVAGLQNAVTVNAGVVRQHLGALEAKLRLIREMSRRDYTSEEKDDVELKDPHPGRGND